MTTQIPIGGTLGDNPDSEGHNAELVSQLGVMSNRHGLITGATGTGTLGAV